MSLESNVVVKLKWIITSLVSEPGWKREISLNVIYKTIFPIRKVYIVYSLVADRALVTPMIPTVGTLPLQYTTSLEVDEEFYLK